MGKLFKRSGSRNLEMKWNVVQNPEERNATLLLRLVCQD